MPEFCDRCEADTVVCQACARIFCSNAECADGRVFRWIDDFVRVDGSKGTGNVCGRCIVYGPAIRKEVA